MIGLIAFLGLLVWIVWRFRKTEARLRSLEREMARVSMAPDTGTAAVGGTLRSESRTPAAAETPEPALAAPTPASLPVGRPEPIPRPAAVERAPVPPPPSAPRPPTPGTSEQLRKRWKPIERLLIENWTGILGAALLVAGVAFLGTYAAVYVGPVLRSAMVVGAAGVLVGIHYWMRERPGWHQLSLWLRSSGAAIFLFACFGAGAIPGLRFIESPPLATAALVAGILTNLYLAFVGRVQTFAALHVVLSLIPLAIIPATQVPFVLGVLVTLIGVGLSYRARWDEHLLVTLAAFAAFHVDWVFGMGGEILSSQAELIGASGALAVASGAALIHYRKEYESRVFERLPFLVHLANWALLGLSLSFYVRDSLFRGWALFAASIAAYLLARRGKALGVRWAHLTDTLVAQGLMMAGVASFYPWAQDRLLIMTALFAQAALYTRVVAGEDEPLLTRIGLYLLHATGGLLLLSGLDSLSADAGARRQNALLLLGAAALGTVRHIFFLRSRGERFDSAALYVNGSQEDVSILGVGIGLFVAAALASVHESVWMPTVALGVIAGLIWTARIIGSRGLTLGAFAAMVAAHVIVWSETLRDPAGSQLLLLAQLAPLVPLAALAIALTPAGHRGVWLRALAVYVAGMHIGIAAYVLTVEASPVIPGVIWLTLSLAALEIANRIRDPAAPAVLHVGYAYVAAFVGAYVLVHMQTYAYLGPVPARMLAEAFGIGTLTYWWLAKPSETLRDSSSWAHIQPYTLELALLLLVTSVTLAVPPQWRPAAWGVLALAGSSTMTASLGATRLRAYALAFFWACAADLAVVTSIYTTPSANWFEQPGVTGLLSIAFLVAFIVRTHPRLGLDGVEFPRGLRGLNAWVRSADLRTPLVVYYPFFLSVAVFLYGRFDRSVLTFLWALEAFGVFILSVLLRENHFRYLALAALGACVVRLIAYDMAQSGTLARGLTFLGVGVLMLAISTIYTRFKRRFE